MNKLLLVTCLFCLYYVANGQHPLLAGNDLNISISDSKTFTDPQSLRGYMQSNLNYPELAVENCVEGDVKLLVHILPDGEVDSAEVTNGIGFGCDEEAVRLALYMPPWQPAIVDGVPVESQVKMTVRFRLL